MAHDFGAQFTAVGESRQQESQATVVMSFIKSREQCVLALSSLSPHLEIQDPYPGNSATPTPGNRMDTPLREFMLIEVGRATLSVGSTIPWPEVPLN